VLEKNKGGLSILRGSEAHKIDIETYQTKHAPTPPNCPDNDFFRGPDKSAPRSAHPIFNMNQHAILLTIAAGNALTIPQAPEINNAEKINANGATLYCNRCHNQALLVRSPGFEPGIASLEGLHMP